MTLHPWSTHSGTFSNRWGIHEESADVRILHCHIFEESSLRICIAKDFTLISALSIPVHIDEENWCLCIKILKMRIFTCPNPWEKPMRNPQGFGCQASPSRIPFVFENFFWPQLLWFRSSSESIPKGLQAFNILYVDASTWLRELFYVHLKSLLNLQIINRIMRLLN